jgi:chromosome segregation ATPase
MPMDNYRITQILQELINNQNSVVSNLNNYLSEAQNSSWAPSYDSSYVQNIQNENQNLSNRVNELSNTVSQLQNDLQNSYNNSSNSGAELESLRNLVTAVTGDRDYLQGQVASKDQQINELNNSYASHYSTVDGLNATINGLNSQVTDLNNKLNEAYGVIAQKQSEYDEMARKEEGFRNSLQQLKSKVASELDEALQDIDQALDEAGK